MGSYLFSSESVTEGHPDKVCDQISDAILDALLNQDPDSRVACETMITTGWVIVSAEITTKADIDYDSIIRQTLDEIGYTKDDLGAIEMQEGGEKKLWVSTLIKNQSPHIAQGVDSDDNHEQGAGDQGLMFGYACRETDVLMPAAIHYSHEILRRMAEARHTKAIFGLGPDSKSQVTLLYENGIPVRATSIVVSTQHYEALEQSDVREIVRPFVEEVLPNGWMCPEDEFYVNPTGRFVIGGPDSDAGITGRKIIVDTYGGAAPHGGGAFSGKDPSKVDRSAAYAARYVAKNVVSAGLADSCEIQVAYAIGVSKPLSVYINTKGTGKVSDDKLADAVGEVMDLSPRNIREHLNLSRPIYVPTSAYGHFGREPTKDGGFSWERTDLVDDLKAALT